VTNAEHMAILKQGVAKWNRWSAAQPDFAPNLRGADFSGSDLRGANLSWAYLSRADLNGADLSGANLSNAYLIDADLRLANLSGANLNRANLTETNLSGADLSEANLDETYIYSTNFADVDLSEVKGLDKANHGGPSSIGIDTIFKSGGKIPEVFLRGAGVPDSFITYMHSLVGQPVQFFSCFISYSAKDKRFCERLYADLQAKGVRTWFFPEDAKWGDSVWGEIDQSIKVYDKLVVVCSKNSLRSAPVLREIERALNREVPGKKEVLFPIRLDDYVFDSWKYERKADVTRKVIGDFSGWNRSAKKYDLAFDKLLRALKADKKTARHRGKKP
jgi:uncharacterized protein YjbI with pentapeptide repeats